MKKIRRKIYNISEKTGKRFGIDLPYFVENGFWVILNQGITVLSGIIISTIFARYFSKELFGQYQFIISILSVVSIATLPGLNTSVSRSVARGFDAGYEDSVRLSFRWSFLGVAILWALSAYFWFDKQTELAIGLFLSSVFFPFMFAPNTWRAFFQGKSRFDLITKFNIVQVAVHTVLLAVLIISFSEVIFGALLGYLAISSVFNVLWYFKSKKVISNKKKEDETIRYGLFITKMQAFGIVANYFDKILVGLFEIEILAVYVIALKMLDMIKSVAKSLSSITFPKFAKKNIKITANQVIILFIAGIIISVFFYYTVDFIVVTLFTHKYDDSILFFKKIVWIAILFPFYFIMVQKVPAQKDKRKYIQLSILPPLLSIIIPVILFIFTGSLGLLVITKEYINFISSFLILIVKKRKK